MKFIGLRLDAHGANVTYTDGPKIKYCEIARDLQIKHFGYHNDMTSWMYLLDRWGVNPKDIDAVCISFDPQVHPELEPNYEMLAEVMEIPVLVECGFECPIWRIEHHLAHALSLWPLNKDIKHHFVFDGFGDDYVTHSRYTITETKHGYSYQKDRSYHKTELVSLGVIMAEVAMSMNISGIMDDLPGKLMALRGIINHYSIEKRERIIDALSQLTIRDLDNVWGTGCFSKLDFEDAVDAVSVSHQATENIFANYFSTVCKRRFKDQDCIGYSGGVALNTVINSKIKKKIPNLIIPPHTNDTGISLGCVELLRQQYNQEPFDNTGFPFWQDDEAPPNEPTDETIREVAENLANNNIVGWYQGHGEIGPRALGHRSILMNPCHPDGKDWINERVKDREWYRPFGASVLEEEVSDYFHWQGPSEYMLFVMELREPEKYPAICHYDNTCRAQTVNESNGAYYKLIKEFQKITGIPMLLNTSLNKGGKPIAARKGDAYDLFFNTGMDSLVFGNNIIYK
jgi:carbamoyltransferase|tara:strand:+ start:1198 stop:2736 length:1539 start_codon:yes stop_codon:yes gene_type:complete